MQKSAVEQFNGLNGAVVSRKELQRLMALANDQEQYHIAEKLSKLLEEYPNAPDFNISIENPVVEQMPGSLLGCLEFQEDTDDTIEGLGKAVSPDQIYKMITDRVVETMKTVQSTDYTKAWKVGSGKSKKISGYLIPYNFVSKKMYRGINRLMLVGATPIANPFFLTFKQVTDLEGKVKQGSTGYPVVYFTRLYSFENEDLKFATYDINKFIAWLEENKSKIGLFASGFSAKSIAVQSAIPILKYYKVFNGSDIEGIDFDLENFKHGYVQSELAAEDENRIEVADLIFENYPQPQPPVHHGGDKAAYYPQADYIRMPKFLDFKTAQDYYRTLFHELAHSTGHASRLGRKLSMEKKSYAFEELIAEFSATFLSAEAGIIWHSNINHAAYLKNWNEYLTIVEEDTRFLMRAATQAQKAADFVLQYDKEGYPAYYKLLEANIKPVKKEEKKETHAIEFVLPDLSPKFEKAIYSAAVNELKRYSGGPDKELSTAALNMLDLVERDLFTLLNFQHGYGRDSKAGEYRNVPTVYRKWKSDEFEKLDKKVLKYLLDKLQEYSYETAWESYNFRGKTAVEILKTVNANIRLIERKISKPKTKPTVEKPVITRKRKSKGNQLSLALNGAKQSKNASAKKPGLKAYDTPEPEPTIVQTVADKQPEPATPVSRNPKVRKIGAINNVASEYFTISGETGKFLQRVERKPTHSVVITLDGEQGAGKTTTLYQWMNDFALPGNSSLFISGEEHPDSDLAKQKVTKYITPAAQQYLDIIGEVDDLTELYELVANYDIIFIDSWQKLLEMVGTINLDKDLRKRFNGKVFVIIFQQTVDGRTKGGSAVVFDGDIITKMVKEEAFADNYAYFNKNRYTLVPLENIRYNIATGKCFNPNQVNDAPAVIESTQNQENELLFSVE